MTGDDALFLELVSLRGENISSHAHKTASWYSLGDLFKISDEYPRPFYLGVSSLPGSETFAFVSVLSHSSAGIRQKLNCAIKWFKKRTTRRK